MAHPQAFKSCYNCGQRTTVSASVCGRCGAPYTSGANRHVVYASIVIVSVILFGILLLAAFKIVSSKDGADANIITSMAEGVDPYDGKPFARKDHDEQFFPVGMDTHDAFDKVSVGLAVGDIKAILGEPFISHLKVNHGIEGSILYAYRDGYVDLIIINGCIACRSATGPYVNPRGYPRIQEEYGRKTGKPVYDGNGE